MDYIYNVQLINSNFEVWPMFLILNVLSALEGTLKIYFSFITPYAYSYMHENNFWVCTVLLLC